MGHLFLIFFLFFGGLSAQAGSSRAPILSASEQRFVEGFQSFQGKKYENVLALFSQPWPTDFLLSPEVMYLKAKSNMALGSSVDVDNESLNPWRLELLRDAAKQTEMADDFARALSLWRTIEEETLSLHQKMEAGNRVALLYDTAGSHEAAVQEWGELLKKIPPKEWLKKIELKINIEGDLQTVLIQGLVERHRFKEAWQLLQRLEDRDMSPFPERLYWLKGRTLYGLGNYESALGIFKKLSRVAVDEAIKANSGERVLSSLVRLGRISELDPDYYEGIKKLYGTSRAAKVWLSIVLQTDQYNDLLAGERFPLPEQTWWKGWAQFQLGKYNEAYQSWYLLRDVRSKYWEARALEKMGQPQGAKRRYEEVAKQDPLGYYGWMALWRYAENQKQAFAFIKRHWVSGNISLARPAFHERSDLHLQRSQRLSELGFTELAGQELSFWYSNRRTNSANDLVALKLAKELQNPAIGFSLVYGYKREALQKLPPPASIQRLYWELAYPKSYESLVEKFSADAHLEPSLVYALIRAESSYQSNAISRTGAIGLMQLMPNTAERVALANGKESFQEEELFEPAANIELGTQYLQFLTALFPEHFMYALAAYNAGEEATARWLGGKRNSDFDIFVEEIPYEETKGYAKKIYQSYWVYRWLYGPFQ